MGRYQLRVAMNTLEEQKIYLLQESDEEDGASIIICLNSSSVMSFGQDIAPLFFNASSALLGLSVVLT